MGFEKGGEKMNVAEIAGQLGILVAIIVGIYSRLSNDENEEDSDGD